MVQLVVHVMTKDFVVPQMALEEISAIEGWRRLWPQVKNEIGGYAAYIGMKIVMAIGAAIILGIVSAIVFLLFLIPIAGLGAVAVIGGMAAGLTLNLYTITLAVVVGTIPIFALLYVLSLVSVPAVVFFPAYSIYFFAARYPALERAVVSRAASRPRLQPMCRRCFRRQSPSDRNRSELEFASPGNSEPIRSV